MPIRLSIRRLDIAIPLALLGLAVWASSATAGSFSEKLTKQLHVNSLREAQRAEERAGGFDEASIRATLPPDADRRAVLRARAVLHEKVAQFERAEADLTAALAITPGDPALHLDRGYFYLRRQRYADAMADFLAGARLEPRRTIHVYAVGRVHAAMGDHERAITSYTEAIRIDPHDARALLARAEAKLNLDRFSDAKIDYDRALRSALRGPVDRFFAFLGRGFAALSLQHYDAAVADFDRALEIDSEAYNAIVWRGYANEMRGRVDLAILDYERAVAHDPTDATSRASLQRVRSK
jgi:tetratricopeptide (TPR) repeat protein